MTSLVCCVPLDYLQTQINKLKNNKTMGIPMFPKKYYKIIVAIAVTIIAILGRKYISYFSFFQEEANDNESTQVISQDQLRKCNGVENQKLHLAVLGNIFDVTQSAKHYGKGAPYHYFVGKDGSRALVTGIFNDESEQKDHTLDLTCSELFNILDWFETFKEKYPVVGLLAGRYYNKYGRETDYFKLLKEKLIKCVQEKNIAAKERLVYPPCNISWNKDEGTRVWCTISSGGVLRNWVGVPRQLYTPGEKSTICVCVQLDRATSKHLRKYEDCPDTSEECFVQTTNK